MVPIALITLGRNRAWHDTRKLLETDLPHLDRCARAHYNYANVLHSDYYSLPAGDQPAAQRAIVHHYRKTLSITDRLFKAYMDLGSAYMEFGQPDSALPVFEEAAERYPYLSVPHFQLGRYHMSAERYREAIPQFQRAIKNGRKNTNAYYHLAVCQVKEQDMAAAIQSLREGLPHQPDFPDYYQLLVQLYANRNDAQLARGIWQQGRSLFPDHQGLQTMAALFEAPPVDTTDQQQN
ncbi:MAG: tetratricopeptide repeat protein, partial [Bacteroidota bacterium]